MNCSCPKTIQEQIVDLYDKIYYLQNKFPYLNNAAGEWNADTVYKFNDWVTFNGSSYMFIAHTEAQGVPVSNTAYWQLIAQAKQGPTGEKGTAGAPQWIANLNEDGSITKAVISPPLPNGNIVKTGELLLLRSVSYRGVAWTAGTVVVYKGSEPKQFPLTTADVSFEYSTIGREGPRGNAGRGITRVENSGTSLGDGFTITHVAVTMTDGTEETFDIQAENGKPAGFINITEVSEAATSGTLTEAQAATLAEDPQNNYIMFYGEKFIPMDVQDENGYRVYTHHGETDGTKQETSKFIYLTLSTRAWAMNVNTQNKLYNHSISILVGSTNKIDFEIINKSPNQLNTPSAIASAISNGNSILGAKKRAILSSQSMAIIDLYAQILTDYFYIVFYEPTNQGNVQIQSLKLSVTDSPTITDRVTIL